MYALDFEYDGRCLSEYGFIICDFDSANGFETVSAGSEITFNTIDMSHGRIKTLTNTKYENCIETYFDICKNPCDNEDMYVTNDEYREIMRWLNQNRFLRFKIIDCDDECDICYYDGSFNIKTIKHNKKVCGFRLNMKTNRPFGYGAKKIFTHEFNESNLNVPMCINDFSDEVGSICPDMKITCCKDGDLTLKNDRIGIETSETKILNCKSNETITIDGVNQIINTDNAEHDIASDFNFNFLTISNTIYDRSNKIFSTLPCKLTISYAPIIKCAP